MEVGIVRSLSTTTSHAVQHPSPQRPNRKKQKRKVPLHRKKDLSAKFRSVVLEDGKDKFLGIFEIATGGTFQRMRLMTKKDYEKIVAPPLPQKDDGADGSTSGSSTSSSARSDNDARLFGDLLRRHNEQRRRSRLRDTLGMLNRDLVGPERRIEITLTSKNTVEDPIKKLGRIVDAIARIWNNDDVFAIWVRALQERGEWHFHLALYNGGELDLSDGDREAIGDYAIKRWQDYAKQEEAVQGAVRLPHTESDLDILDAYDSGQETKKKKAKDPKDDDDDVEAPITKKTKLFGVLRRGAYWRHVEITKFVVEDLSDLFTLRRLHRRALQGRMRSWRRPRRHRPHRYAVEGRFHLPEKISLKLFDFVRTERYGEGPRPPETLP